MEVAGVHTEDIEHVVATDRPRLIGEAAVIDVIVEGRKVEHTAVVAARELVAAHDGHLAKAREALSVTTDEHLMTNWKLKVHGKVVADKPRHIMIRDAINHWAHHRGQLTVYLRLNDAPVPAIYGPSADDARFD